MELANQSTPLKSYAACLEDLTDAGLVKEYLKAKRAKDRLRQRWIEMEMDRRLADPGWWQEMLR